MSGSSNGGGYQGYETIRVRTASEESRYQRWRDGTDRLGVQGLMNEQDAGDPRMRAFLEAAGVIAPMPRPITDFTPHELRRLADQLESTGVTGFSVVAPAPMVAPLATRPTV